MKKTMAALLAGITVLLAGCSAVSQAEYNSAVSAEKELNEKNQQLNSDYSVLQEQYDSLTSDYELLQKKYDALQKEYNSVTESVAEKTTTATTTSTPEELPSTPEELSPYEQFVQENNITLDNFDVQFDMGNNLEKYFTLTGTAELDDYYNYGFDDDMEKDFFCVQVDPEGGSYSNRWYIYCHRETFYDLFDDLKGSKINVQMVCLIPTANYEPGQNNMALLMYVAW
ncbi:MAG: hypothetical protein ACI4RK_02340 [Oscillospiraceae bacterium]